MKETHSFQAEAQQLLHLVIHSLYSHREVFLRELVSNAADALDKARIESMKSGIPLEGEPTIRISSDLETGILTLSDNGVGMSREEVIEHIGTIANSGTRRFLESLQSDSGRGETNLIGQFGVGFYSAFMVADRVVVITRRLGNDEAVCWESSGDGEYTMEEAQRDHHGTDVILHIAETHRDFMDPERIRGLINRYSNHVAFPVFMSAGGEEEQWEQINAGQALWRRPKTEISDEQYQHLYHDLTFDPEDPLCWSHFKIEGRTEYTALLYVAAHAQGNLFDPEAMGGIRLYVQSVLVMEQAKALLPRYLRFMLGVVDSADLPLNVSRELLQSSHTVDSIRGGLTRRSLDMLENMARQDQDRYQTFWKAFGVVLKEGVMEDAQHKDRIVPMLRFRSVKGNQEMEYTSLDDYLQRMPFSQKAIYYVWSESGQMARSNPHLTTFQRADLEVLLLTDPIDEWLVMQLKQYQDKPLQSIRDEQVELPEQGQPESEMSEQEKSEGQALAQRIQSDLDGLVERVTLSRRSLEAPAALVQASGSLSPAMIRLLKESGQQTPVLAQRILEINASHPWLSWLGCQSEDEMFHLGSMVLYEQALLADGEPLTDPSAFASRLVELVKVLTQSGSPSSP